MRRWAHRTQRRGHSDEGRASLGAHESCAKMVGALRNFLCPDPHASRVWAHMIGATHTLPGTEEEEEDGEEKQNQRG